MDVFFIVTCEALYYRRLAWLVLQWARATVVYIWSSVWLAHALCLNTDAAVMRLATFD